MKSLLWCCAAAVSAASLCFGCSGDKPTGSTGPAATSRASSSAESPGSSGSAVPAASSAVPPAPPACALDNGTFNDWDDWAPGCSFGSARGAAGLAPRLAWEACGAPVGLPGCKKLKPRAGAAITSIIGGLKRPDVVEVGYVEGCKTDVAETQLFVVAELDGPTLVSFASLAAAKNKCELFPAALSNGAYAARLVGESGSDLAWVGAPTQASKPALLRKIDDPSADSGIVVSDQRWITFGPNGARMAPWGSREVQSLTDDALNVRPSLWSDVGYWADVDVWWQRADKKPVKAQSAKDGERWEGLGTDGRSIVAVRSERTPDGVASAALLSADVPRDAEPIAWTHVLSLPSGPGADPWTVGCGFAAHATADNQVLVVRLKDGVSWQVASAACKSGAAEALCFTRPLALTCAEVIVGAAQKDKPQGSVVRLTISGLGKGTEPKSAPQPLGAPSAAPSASASAAPSVAATAKP